MNEKTQYKTLRKFINLQDPILPSTITILIEAKGSNL